MAARRVLLTGATGLIGRQAVPSLVQAGYEVVALSRSGRAIAGANSMACDLLDGTALDAAVAQAKASHLLHLAWHDNPQDRWTSAANLDWAAASFRLLRRFADGGGTRAVCVGSCAEYAWDREVLSEDSPLAATSLYGKVKAATGNALMATAPALGLSLSWARVFFCYGPGEPEGRLLGDLINGIRTGQQVDCTDGLQARDFLHTADIAAGLTALLGSGAEGAVNIGSGTGTQVKDLINGVAHQMGRPDLVRLGARPRPATDPDRLIADVTRLTEEVGFAPAYTIETGIAAVLNARGDA